MRTGFLASALLLFIVNGASGVTFYVAANGGSNTNSCAQAQSSGMAKKTIAEGIACMVGGDTLMIGDGTYPEHIIGTIPNGSASGSTTVRAANRNKAILAPTTWNQGYVIRFSGNRNITLDGIVADAANAADTACFGFFPDSSTNIILQNGTARNGQGTYGSGIDGLPMNSQILNMDILDNGSHENLAHGIYMSGSGNIVDGNRIRNSGAYGIVLYSSAVSVDDNIVRNNTIHDNTDRGVGLFSGRNNLFYNNVVFGNGRGFDVEGSNQTIFNNTVYGNAGICIDIRVGSGHQVRNNICWQNGGGDLQVQVGGNTLANNLCGAAGAGCSRVGNPQFFSATGTDFHLTANSANAIDRGADLSAVFTMDFDNRLRPAGAWDIGAYEYDSGSTVSRCDLDGNSTFNSVDLQILTNAIFTNSKLPANDLNRDSSVNAVDAQILVNVILGTGSCP